MVLDGFNGRSLFKVDLETGLGEQMERAADEDVVDWWLDVDGTPVVRVDGFAVAPCACYRKDAEGKWKKFYSMRMREMKERPDYEAVGPSDQPGKYYVLARPPGKDRIGLYLYDLEKEASASRWSRIPTYDIVSAQVSRDGKQRASATATTRTCASASFCRREDRRVT